jgi:hypothetical protein
MKSPAVSKRYLRKKIRECHDGEISNESIDYLQKYLTEYTNYIIYSACNINNQYNQRRQKAHLPRLKRLNVHIFKSLLGRSYKQLQDKITKAKVEQLIDTHLCLQEVT